MRPSALKVGLLFAVSFSLSSAWISLNPQQQNSKRPDAILFESIAANLAEGNGFSADREPPFRPEITRAPFLPVLGAAVYSAVGRARTSVLWLNALLVAAAVALCYVVARRLFPSDGAAYAGAWVVCLTPQVSGATNAFLTEAPAMLQVVLGIWALLRWPEWRGSRRAPLAACALGLLLASIVLNRPNLAPAVLIAGTWMALSCLRGDWRKLGNWVTVLVLGVALGVPVLAWSARNASLGLSFTPMGVGKGAGYVYEVSRYRDLLLEGDDRLPARAQREFWDHYRRPLGPAELIELDRENMEWFENWIARRRSRVVAATPHRLLALFSQDRVSTYRQPWPYADERDWSARVRWLSRLSWMISALGLVLVWRRRPARWIWLVTVGGTVLLALMSACNPRYLTPLLPLGMLYPGVVLAAIASLARRLLAPRRAVRE